MCNAWNHPPSCTCGWGGIFYGLGVKSNKYYWQVSESYTNPNATCPNCRARVFYYVSPFGGKVYFDHMGPPWPKHSCMGLCQAQAKMKLGTSPLPTTAKPQSKKFQIEDGWRHVYCADITNSSEYAGCIVLSLYELENRKYLYAEYPKEKIDVRSPLLIRRVKNASHYEVSTLSLRDASPSELRFFAFRSVVELKKFRIEMSVPIKLYATQNPVTSNMKERADDLLQTKRKIQHEPNREVKITVHGRRSKVLDQATGKEKIQLEKNVPKEPRPSSVKAKRREEALKKRQDRETKRLAKAHDEKNKEKLLMQTAIEHAFEKSSTERRKDKS